MMDLKRSIALIESGIERGWHIGAQLSVGCGGEGCDIALGEASKGVKMAPDTLMLWLSSGKPVAAVAIAQLLEKGFLRLDDPIVRFIPEFGQHGKEAITIRHVLTHTAGIRTADSAVQESSLEAALGKVYGARMEPRWIPGKDAGYHLGGSWLLLGELIRRLDGRSYGRYVREEIFLPLGMNDCWVGVPDEACRNYGPRMGVMQLTEKNPIEPHPFWEREGEISLEKPGSHARGPIRELNRFYRMLLNGGELDGQRVLSSGSVDLLISRHRTGMVDRTFKFKMDLGLGFILQSEASPGEEMPYGYGRYASPGTFGHSGSRSSSGFADPARGVAITYVFNGMPSSEIHHRRALELCEAIYADLFPDLVTE